MRDSTLYAHYVNFDIGALVHTSYDSFRSKTDDPMEGITELTFTPDGTGGIASASAFGTTFVRSPTKTGPHDLLDLTPPALDRRVRAAIGCTPREPDASANADATFAERE